MKVTTEMLTNEELYDVYNTVILFFRNVDDDASNKFKSVLLHKRQLGLTFIGNYKDILDFKDTFRWHVSQIMIKYQSYFDEIKDGILFNMKDGYIENRDKTSNHKSKHIGENSPITSGENYTIDTPSSKAKSEIDNTDNIKTTKTDLEDIFKIFKLSNGLSIWAFFDFFINLGFEEYHRLY